MNIDHDHLFKELLSTFFVEFLELFLPEVLQYLDPTSLILLDKELIGDATVGEVREADVVMQARYRNEDAFFLVHIEHQSTAQSEFNQRMFRYFARLHEKYNQPVYPIAVFSFDSPQRPEPHNYVVEFSDRKVLQFDYAVIQLNQYDWHTFVTQPNPVASALMSKMKIAPPDRPRVKLECLKMLVGLELNSAQTYFISGFIDTYLRLDETEDQIFQTQMTQELPSRNKEEVMEIVTSWMEKGIAQGLQRGEANVLVKLLARRFGPINPITEAQIRALSSSQLDVLSDAVLDFSSTADLTVWLNKYSSN